MSHRGDAALHCGQSRARFARVAAPLGPADAGGPVMLRRRRRRRTEMRVITFLLLLDSVPCFCFLALNIRCTQLIDSNKYFDRIKFSGNVPRNRGNFIFGRLRISAQLGS